MAPPSRVLPACVAGKESEAQTMSAMEEVLTTRGQRQLVADLRQLVEGSLQTRQQLESQHQQTRQQYTEQHTAALAELAEAFRLEDEALEAEYTQQLTDARLHYETKLDRLTQREMELSEGETRSCKKSVSDAKYDWFLENRQCRRNLEAQREQTVGAYQKLKRQYREHGEALQRLEQRVEELARRRRCRWIQPGVVAPPPLADGVNHLDRFVLRSKWVHDSILEVRRRPASRFLDEGWVVLVFLFAFVLCLYPAYLVLQWSIAAWLLASAGRPGHFAGGLLSGAWQAVRLVRAFLPRVSEGIFEARAALDLAEQEDRQNAKLQLEDLRAQYAQQLADLDRHWQASVDRLHAQHDAKRRQIADRFAQRRVRSFAPLE